MDDSLDDKIRVTVIATGFSSAQSAAPRPEAEPQAQEDGETSRSDANFMKEGEFERITGAARRGAQAQKPDPKDELFGTLFSGVYEEDAVVRPSPAQQKPQGEKAAAQQFAGGAAGPRQFSANDDDVPAALRVDITGLPKKMSFGKR